MFEDDNHGHDSTESSAELSFRIHWVCLGLIAAICGGGNAPWSMGVVAIMGVVGLALTGANWHVSGEKSRKFFLRFLFWMLPVWFVVVTFLIGLNYPPYYQLSVGGIKSWLLSPLPAGWMPESASFKVAGIAVLVVVGVYGCTINALLLCKSRLVFARTWAGLVIGAGGLALLGLLQFFGHADQLLWAIPMDNVRFFSTFSHPALWSAFAILWLGAGLGLLGWLVSQRGWRWHNSWEGWVLLGSTVLLALSIVAAGDPLHKILGAIVASIGSFVIAWQTRQERRASQRPGWGSSLLAWIVAGLALAAGAALVATHYPTSEWIRYDGQTSTWPIHERVIEDARNMWLQRRWLGWGYNSFPVVYSFFQGADQNDVYRSVARSDFWQSLAEHGIIGTLIWWVPALWIVARLLLNRRFLKFLIPPAAALVAVAVLSIVDFPFACPTVYFGFWFILFSLARWVEVDRADAVFKPGERKRIEKLRGQGQTLAQPPTSFGTPSGKPKA